MVDSSLRKILVCGIASITCIVFLFYSFIFFASTIGTICKTSISISEINYNPYRAKVQINFENSFKLPLLYTQNIELYSNLNMLNMEYNDCEFVYYVDGEKIVGQYDRVDNGVNAKITSNKDVKGYLSFNVTGENKEYINNVFLCYGKVRISAYWLPFKDVNIYENYYNYAEN